MSTSASERSPQKLLRAVQMGRTQLGEFVRHRYGWRLYGNTLSIDLNRRYNRYWADCRAAYRAETSATIDIKKSPIWNDGIARIPAALDSGTAQGLSKAFSGAIANGENILPGSHPHLSVELARPLEVFGDSILSQVFEERGAVDAALKNYLGSYYRLHKIVAYRSLETSGAAMISWLWHIDNKPYCMPKVMLHLTPADARRGAMRFLSFQETMALHAKGYIGKEVGTRIEGVDELSRQYGLQLRERHIDCQAGDALIFHTNLMHRAVSPEEGFRDVITFVILPNPISWSKQLAITGTSELHTNSTKQPSDPRPAQLRT